MQKPVNFNSWTPIPKDSPNYQVVKDKLLEIRRLGYCPECGMKKKHKKGCNLANFAL